LIFLWFSLSFILTSIEPTFQSPEQIDPSVTPKTIFPLSPQFLLAYRYILLAWMYFGVAWLGGIFGLIVDELER
jgi:hypothetical protein